MWGKRMGRNRGSSARKIGGLGGRKGDREGREK